MKNINTEINSSIAVVKIERKAHLNALNKNVIEQLSNELEVLESNKEVIIIGEGSKAFVAGADIKEFSNFSIEQGCELSKVGQDTLFNKIENFKKPIIAAINGYALGGGLEFVF